MDPTWEGPVGPPRPCFRVCCKLRGGCQSLSREQGPWPRAPEQGGPQPATRKHGPLDESRLRSDLQLFAARTGLRAQHHRVTRGRHRPSALSYLRHRAEGRTAWAERAGTGRSSQTRPGAALHVAPAQSGRLT